MTETVEITPDTIKLVEQLNIDTRDDIPTVSSKRPFGNSDYYRDILQIIGREDTIEGEDMIITDEGKELVELHLELVSKALSILVDTQSLEVGTYKNDGSGWEKV